MTLDSPNKGFTLIEILIVMLIIGIASTFIVLKIGAFHLSNKNSSGFAREMTGLINLAHQQSILSMETLGIRISKDTVSFLRFDSSTKSNWVSMAQTDHFWADRNIPHDLNVNYQLGESKKSIYQNSNNDPQILLQPSGEITPFIISIQQTNSHKSHVISSDDEGHVMLTETGI